ncbi:hypothetical protein MLD38_035693 [Melastoma candidum]|uniref:Uncharacterized protein n=1 Tax=Melastoma candidum TaxID=119954 RepID=A0ACB9LHC4_9MYRT|nr:hypothetical protein MLD38_035693 [Melastoma candidum]
MFPTCRRALGLASNSSGYLYFCDYSNGLLGVSSSGGEATTLVEPAGDLPVYYYNGVELGSNGMVYFTDASQVYSFCFTEYCRNTTLMVANDDTTGKLLKYEPTTGEDSVLASGLVGLTGLTTSSDGSYLLINEMVGSTICRKFTQLQKP